MPVPRSLGVMGSVVLWALAFVIAGALGVWQRFTDPSGPREGRARLSDASVAYRFVREGPANEPIRVTLTAPDDVSGNLRWRLLSEDDAFESLTMLRDGADLVGFLPASPPGTRIEYSLVLAGPSGLTWVPDDGAVALRVQGAIPSLLSLVHGLLVFLSVLFGVRAALGALWGAPDVGWLSLATLAVLTLGGIVLRPVISTLAFASIWTGWPLGDDWGANGALVSWLLWLVAVLAVRSVDDPSDRFARITVVGAALVMTAVSLVPRAVL